MKISTKIILGFGILIAMMAVLAVYQVIMIGRLQQTVQDLTSVNFQAAREAAELRHDLDMIQEYTRKYFASADTGYAAWIEEFRPDYEAKLERLAGDGRSENEAAEAARLKGFWTEYLERYMEWMQRPPQGGDADLPAELAAGLEQLRIQSDNVYLAITAEIERKGKKALETGRGAKILSLSAAGLALITSVVISFVIVQSISIPLRHLTQGTRAIAEGKFFYRLDTSHRDEFSQLAKDFNTMTQRLNELDQMKKDFVSHVSHELKAPLASIQETIQLLLDGVPGGLTEKQRRLLELNTQSASRLSAMIGNLLDISRLEAGVIEYELRSLDLARLVRTTADELKGAAEERGIGLDVQIPGGAILVKCDGERIAQVLRNLLGNAVKFSPKGGKIGIRLAADARPPDALPEAVQQRIAVSPGAGLALLSVSDNGPGVPDAHKEKIFEKFHQVKQGKKVPGQGAGLGLSISRRITEAHGGAIWVEDNPGGGSVFRLLLPCGENDGDVTYRKSQPI